MMNKIKLKKKRNGQDLEQQIRDSTLYKIEFAIEKNVIADIRKRQKSIPDLRQDKFKYTAIWGDGELTPGCKDCCLKGKWAQIRTTTKCNLNCSFCYYFGLKDHPGRELIPEGLYIIAGNLFKEDDVKLLLERQGKKFINGVAWLHYEPLMELDKIPSLMKFVHRKGYHQWMYTNGVLANEGNLKQLSDAGLNEIRFNLAATNCSDVVIKNMAVARKYFKYLCIESPMFSGFYNIFMRKRKAILDTGVDHIHFAELQLFKETVANFKNEGPIYRYKKGYISPIKSRQLTYDVFDVAVKERWKNVVLHDCSNETKFFRGVNIINPRWFGDVSYKSSMKLEASFYKNVLLRSDFDLPLKIAPVLKREPDTA